jgi:hypothetical protein
MRIRAAMKDAKFHKGAKRGIQEVQARGSLKRHLSLWGHKVSVLII